MWISKTSFRVVGKDKKIDCQICGKKVSAELVSANTLVGAGIPLLVDCGKEYAFRCTVCQTSHIITNGKH